MNYLKKKRRLFILGLFLCFCFGFIGLFTYSYEDTYLFDDLKQGDFLLNGVSILTDYDYHNASMIYEEKVNICYSSFIEDTENLDRTGLPSLRCIEIASRSREKISTYQDIYGTDYSFKGWVVVSVAHNSIYLEPADEGAEILVKPTEENQYTLEARCIDGTNALNKWYQYEEIEEPVFSNTNSSLWNYAKKQLRYSEFDTHATDYTETVTFTFTANKGQLLFFESRLFLKDYSSSNLNLQDTLLVSLDGERLSLNESDFYQKNYYTISSDGEHTLQFSFQKGKSAFSYMHVKNLRVLTYLGDAASLDVSSLEDGDLLYYETLCGDYLMSGVTHVVKEEVKEIEPVPDSNPPTKDVIYKYMVLAGISLVLVLFLLFRIKYKRP